MVTFRECRGQQVHTKVEGSVQERLQEARGLARARGGGDQELDSGHSNELAPHHSSLVMQ